ARRLPHRRHVGAAPERDRGAGIRTAPVRRLHRPGRNARGRRPGGPARGQDTGSGDPFAGAARPRHRARTGEVRGMMPFLDLKAQYASIKDEIDAAVLKVLASGQYVLGDEVAAFEEEFAAYCGAKHAIAVNTGTSALHLALL